MKRKIELNRNQIPVINIASDKSDFDTITSISDDWGEYLERSISLPCGTISSITINMNNKSDELHIMGNQSPDYVQLCMLMMGGAVYESGQITLGSQEERFNKFRLAYSKHEDYKVAYQDTVDLMHISVKAEYYLNFLSEQEQWSARLRERILNQDSVFQKNTTMSLPMLHCVNAIVQNRFQGNLRRVMIEAKLQELLGWQLDSYANNRESATEVSREQENVFYELREYLNNTFAEEHSLSSLCRKFGLNNFKLKTVFKQMFSKTVFEYIVEKRLDAAYQFIVDTRTPLAEVCVLTGYKNQAHFSTAFKKRFGAAPSALRK